MATQLTDRINRRMAAQALSEFVAADCIVESDETGPRLWEIAKKGLATGPCGHDAVHLVSGCCRATRTDHAR